MSFYLFLSGLLGLTAVGLGAFGAHALKPILLERGLLEAWHTGVLYHLVHAAAVLAVSLLPATNEAGAPRPGARLLRAACACWLVGIVLFSGSLYLMAGLGWSQLGFITPLGGVALLTGWACVMLAGWKSARC
ncbi:MAG TPA: DUF423 domain-containing protein [Opitutaceae bacterium]|nr:DUF423 domain-containing protein [Opitutaceae bacterium]